MANTPQAPAPKPKQQTTTIDGPQIFPGACDVNPIRPVMQQTTARPQDLVMKPDK